MVGPGSPPETELNPPHREPIPSLTREYREEQTNYRWEVDAYAVAEDDPELENGTRPWRLRATPSGPYEFYVNVKHPAFASATLTPLDALLVELAWQATDAARGTARQPVFAGVLVGLRDRYAGANRLDPVTLSAEAASLLRAVARSAARSLDAATSTALFQSMSPHEQEVTLTRLSARSDHAHPGPITNGRWFESAPKQTLPRFLAAHPELFFDGRYWDVPYGELDYGLPSANQEARGRLVRHYTGLLNDAVWLADQDAEDLADASRERLLRAALSLELLSLDVRDGEAA
jgi:hypothetical protein